MKKKKRKTSLTSKQLILSAAILSLVITAGAISYVRAADTEGSETNTAVVGQENVRNGWGFAQRFNNRKEMNGAFKEVREAIENNDYQAWAELMNQRPNANELVNEETFAKLREMQELMQVGDRDGAKKIADELGMMRFGKKSVANQQFQAIREAVQNKDYDAWAKLMGGLPNYQGAIDQETFDKHVELDGLMRRANELQDELGIHEFEMQGMMHGPMPRRGQGTGPQQQGSKQ